MDTVKRLFGVMMLAVAAWMLARVLPERFALLLWAIPALICGGLLWTQTRKRSTVAWVVRVAGAAVGLYGVALIAGLGGWTADRGWRPGVSVGPPTAAVSVPGLYQARRSHSCAGRSWSMRSST